MTKLKRTPEGFYDIKGRIYEKLRGTRRQVYDYRTAYKTAGGLTRKDLVKNKAGRIVSKAKFDQGPTLLKNLTSRGFYTRKGKFGAKKKGGVTKKNKNAKKMKKQKGGMDTELKKLKEDYISKINNAQSIEEVNTIVEELTEKKTEMVKEKLGDEKNPFNTTKEQFKKFHEWNKNRAEINDALNIDVEVYKKKQDLGQEIKLIEDPNREDMRRFAEK